VISNYYYEAMYMWWWVWRQNQLSLYALYRKSKRIWRKSRERSQEIRKRWACICCSSFFLLFITINFLRCLSIINKNVYHRRCTSRIWLIWISNSKIWKYINWKKLACKKMFLLTMIIDCDVIGRYCCWLRIAVTTTTKKDNELIGNRINLEIIISKRACTDSISS
jgi:hypothetical protein